MALAILPGSEVSTSQVGVRLDPNPARQAALMRGNQAAALGDSVAGFFGEVGRKFQDNINARTVLDADLKMRKFTDDYRDSLAKNPNEDTWVANLQDQSSQLRDEILSGPHVGPDVRNQLTSMLDRWEQATTSEVKTAAQIQAINRTKKTVIEDYTYSARQGDEKGALAAIQHGVDNHALFPEDADRMRKELPAIIQTAQVETGIQNKPLETLKLLEDQAKGGKSKAFPALDPQKLGMKIREAHAATARWQSDNLNRVLEDAAASPEGAGNPDEVRAMAERGEITARAATNTIKGWEKKGVEKAQSDFNVRMLEVQVHDFTADKNPDETAREIKDSAAALPPALQRRVFQSIDNRVKSAKKAGEAAEKPIEREIFSRLRQDFEQGFDLPGTEQPLASGEVVPGTEHKIPWVGFKFGGTPKTETVPADKLARQGWMHNAPKELRDAAIQHYADAMADMRDWFESHAKEERTNPTKFEADAETHRQKLMEPYIQGAVQHSLDNPNPTPRARPPNGVYFSKSTGKWADKDKNEIP